MNLIVLQRALGQLRLGGMATVLETRLRQAHAEGLLLHGLGPAAGRRDAAAGVAAAPRGSWLGPIGCAGYMTRAADLTADEEIARIRHQGVRHATRRSRRSQPQGQPAG